MILTLLLAATLSTEAFTIAGIEAKVEDRVLQAIEAAGATRVIINLHHPSTPLTATDERKYAIDEAQQFILSVGFSQ